MLDSTLKKLFKKIDALYNVFIGFSTESNNYNYPIPIKLGCCVKHKNKDTMICKSFQTYI